MGFDMRAATTFLKGFLAEQERAKAEKKVQKAMEGGNYDVSWTVNPVSGERIAQLKPKDQMTEYQKAQIQQQKIENQMKMTQSGFTQTQSDRYTPEEFGQLPREQIDQMMPKGGWTPGQGLPTNPNITNIPGLGMYKPSPSQQQIPEGYTLWRGKLIKLPTERDITPSTAATILADRMKLQQIEKSAPGITKRLQEIIQGKTFVAEEEKSEEIVDMMDTSW